MLTALLSLIALGSAAKAEVWYGPTDVVLPVTTQGNPYDTLANDVRVRFSGPGGDLERYGFFDGKRWRVRLAATRAGDYTGDVTLNGRSVGHVAAKLSKEVSGGYVRVNDDNDGFVTSAGQTYWPVGMDIGWDSGPQMTVVERLQKLGQAGGNWSRIWQCPWDDKNPFWAESVPKPKLGEMIPAVFDKWDKIVREAEGHGIKFQWVLHHHGLFSSTVNPNWPDHPWNAKNGGFLAKADDFFTDARAKKYTKDMLRYVVARYADSPSVMAWELFNEVQFTDAARDGHWNDVGAWHDEMAAYLKSIDPYHHLVTTSSELDKPIWRNMDYYQPHGYPADVGAMVASLKLPGDKPCFYGEIGFGGEPIGGQAYRAVTDGIMAAAIMGHAGAAQFWYWDQMGHGVPWDVFKYSAMVAKRLPRDMGPAMLSFSSPSGADLVIAPGRGWEKSGVSAFSLPADVDGGKAALLSGFLQGKAHPEMSPNTLTLEIEAKSSGTLKAAFAGAASSGTTVELRLDGKIVASASWPANGKGGKVLSANYPRGKHTFQLVNTGPDWAEISRLTVSGMGRAANAVVGRSPSTGIVAAYIRRNIEQPTTFTLGGKIPAGVYSYELVDLHTGASSRGTVTNGDNGFEPLPKLTGKDMVFIAEPKRP